MRMHGLIQRRAFCTSSMVERTFLCACQRDLGRLHHPTFCHTTLCLLRATDTSVIAISYFSFDWKCIICKRTATTCVARQTISSKDLALLGIVLEKLCLQPDDPRLSLNKCGDSIFLKRETNMERGGSTIDYQQTLPCPLRLRCLHNATLPPSIYWSDLARTSPTHILYTYGRRMLLAALWAAHNMLLVLIKQNHDICQWKSWIIRLQAELLREQDFLRLSCIMYFIRRATIVCSALLLIAVMLPTMDAAPGVTKDTANCQESTCWLICRTASLSGTGVRRKNPLTRLSKYLSMNVIRCRNFVSTWYAEELQRMIVGRCTCTLKRIAMTFALNIAVIKDNMQRELTEILFDKIVMIIALCADFHWSFFLLLLVS